MTSQSQHSGLLRTILFVDVCGSTKLYEVLGNTRAQAVVARTLDVLSRATARHSGEVVKTIGDELMCTFANASDAAQAAVDMQRSLRQETDTAVSGIQVRTGFHCGPVISDQADVFGDAVNIAARVVAHAKPGQILLTKQTVENLPSPAGDNVRFIGSTQVKGKEIPLELFEVIWDRENLTQLQAVVHSTPGNARLTVTLGDVVLDVGPSLQALRMGRGSENEFVIADPLASRLHARIEYRRNRFVLVDQSLNGTYLRQDGKPEVSVRRDEVTLEGSGAISLGQSTSAERALCVRFVVHEGRGTQMQAMPRPPGR